MVEPALHQVPEVGRQVARDRHLRPQVDVTRDAGVHGRIAVHPRPHQQRLLRQPRAQRLVVLHRGARVGVVPGAGVHGRHVGGAVVVGGEVEAGLLPELVRVAVLVEVPRAALVARQAGQRRLLAAPRQACQPLVHPLAGAGETRLQLRIPLRLARHRAEGHRPGEPAQLQRAVMAQRRRVAVGAALVDPHRLEVRRPFDRRRVLDPGQVGGAVGADVAVAVRQRRQPLDRVVAVRSLVRQQDELAFRGVAPAAVLDRRQVAVAGQELAHLLVGGACAVVRGAHQDGGKRAGQWLAVAGRPPDVGGQPDAVARGHAAVAGVDDSVRWCIGWHGWWLSASLAGRYGPVTIL